MDNHHDKGLTLSLQFSDWFEKWLDFVPSASCGWVLVRVFCHSESVTVKTIAND